MSKGSMQHDDAARSDRRLLVAAALIAAPLCGGALYLWVRHGAAIALDLAAFICF